MAEIIYDVVDPAQLTGFVRELPVPTEIGLNAVLPDRVIPDIEATINSVQRTNRAAKFRAFDAETPIGKRDTFQSDRVGLPPLGQKTVITEYERLQLNRLQGQGEGALLRTIYDDAEINARAVRIRAELARGDLLADGKVTITENGLEGLEYDAGVPNTHIVSASVSWATHASSAPLEDLQTWIDLFEAAGGIAGRLLTSTTGLRHAMQSTALRQMAAANGYVPSSLNRNQVNSLLDSHGLPPIEVYNGQFDVDGSTVRALAADKLLVLPQNPEDLGYTAWGITAEALEIAEAQRIGVEDAPGLIAVVMKDGDPVRKWTKVAATCLPILTNPRRIVIADIVT